MVERSFRLELKKVDGSNFDANNLPGALSVIDIANKGNLFKIELYPITLGFGKKRTIRGRPMLANKVLSKKIIDDLAERPKPFGTKVEFKDGIGVINIVN